MNTALSARKAVQMMLEVAQDGVWGPKTDAAYAALKVAPPDSPWPPVAAAPAPSGEIHTGIASSFADPADVEAFRKCKAQGRTDQDCFSVGDNAVGCFGDSTAEGSGPSFALPPEDWKPFGAAARFKRARITGNGQTCIAELKDTMPHKAAITNNCIIDLNPDTLAQLGWKPGDKYHVSWQWL